MSILKSQLCFRIVFIIDVTFLLLVQISQGGALNYIFIKDAFEYLNTYILFAIDLLCSSVFFATAVISYKYFTFQKTESTEVDGNFTRKFIYLRDLKSGVLPMSYISWFLYASVLVGKLWVIFMINNNLSFKPQILQVCLGMSSIVFMLLVEAHNWHKKSTLSYSYVIDICKKIGIEIFDSVEMLEFLIKYDDMSRRMEYGVFTLACANFFLPTISLYRLSISCFGKCITPHCVPVKIIHDLLRVSLIDIPFFIVRLHMWILHGELSMFMVKNLFYILMSVRELYLDLYMFFRPLPSNRNPIAEEFPLNDDETQTDGYRLRSKSYFQSS